MKNILILIAVILTLSANSQTNVSGGIYIDSTWTLINSPFIVTDILVVFPGVTLTIEPGVVVKFADHKYIEIRNGTLIANGNSQDSITFTSNSLAPVPGIWGDNYYGGIWLNGATAFTSFNYCILNYATKGIYNGEHLSYIKNSIFFNNLSGLGSIFETHIDSCIFKFNNNGIDWASACALSFCNISNNTNAIGELGGGNLENCTIDSNLTGLGGTAGVDGARLYNCILNYNQTGLVTNQIGDGTSIKNCTVNFNNTLGLGIYGRGRADSVINCEIKFNGIGLVAASCPDIGNNPSLFTQCIIENNNIGIQVGGCSNIYCNKFCNNYTFDLQNLTSHPYNLPNNNWCTSDSFTIAAHIYDGYDNVSLGLISFLPVDTSNCFLATGIQIYEARTFDFMLSPNPATNQLSVSSQQLAGKNVTIDIYNVLGEKVLILPSSIFHLPSSIINISSLSPGIYFLQLKTESSNVVKKFIKSY